MLLALDTATATASLAVYDRTRDHLLGEMTWEGRRRQTQDLLVAARSLLDLLEVAPEQVTALAVTTGPGSFTGVRIAISAAKGIGLGLARSAGRHRAADIVRHGCAMVGRGRRRAAACTRLRRHPGRSRAL